VSAVSAGAVPFSHQQRRLLGQLPNNYGSAPHVPIRIENGCVLPVQVAIMFWFNPWGTPTGCTYSGIYGDGTTKFCVQAWQTIQPGETKYLAETGYASWFFSARLAADPNSTTWGSSEFHTLQWAACSQGTPDCFGWNRVRWGAATWY